MTQAKLTLKDLRMQHENITQKQLASFLHVDRSAISKWETGKQAPDYDMIKRIANFFDVPLVSVVEMFIKEERDSVTSSQTTISTLDELMMEYDGGDECPQR